MKKSIFLFFAAILYATSVWAVPGFNQGNVYFDKSGWNDNCSYIYLAVGHDTWSSLYRLDKTIQNTQLVKGWCSNGGWWNGMNYFAIMGAGNSWNGGSFGYGTVQGAPHYTGKNSSVDINSSSKPYLCTKASADNGAALTITEKTSITDLNYTQTVKYAVSLNGGTSKVMSTGETPAKITMSSYKFVTEYDKVSAETPTAMKAKGTIYSTDFSAAHTATTTLEISELAGDYKFDGWYTAAAGGTKLSGDWKYTYYPTKPTTVYARFSEITCYLMGVAGDWTTGIKMTLNPEDNNEFILLNQPINEPIKFKYEETWTADVDNYKENDVQWVESGTGNYNIVLPAGNYDFYFKKDIKKVYIARNTVVTTTANPAEGGTLTGAGVYNNDEEVTLKATPNTGYDFVNWTKDSEVVSNNATYKFKAAGDVELMANFKLKTYTVKFLNYDGEVLQSSTVNHGETPVYSGKTPEHPADAQYTYTFSGWDNAIAAATSDQTYKAQFNTTVNQYTITVNAENGIVTGAGTYDYGTSVTITATPDTGYEFVNWTKAGVEVSTDASYTFTVTEDVDLVANFAKEVYTRTTTIGSYGTICLPFGSDDYSGAEFYEVAYLVEGTGLWLDQLAAGDQLVAGKPYIFKATATELVVVSNATEVADPVAGANGLTGTFTDIATGDPALVGNYIIAQNQIWIAGAGNSLPANRAYIDESLVPTTAQAKLPGRRRVQMGENAATGLDNITNGENTVIKTIENGQLIIIRNGEKFNAQGVRL